MNVGERLGTTLEKYHGTRIGGCVGGQTQIPDHDPGSEAEEVTE